MKEFLEEIFIITIPWLERSESNVVSKQRDIMVWKQEIRSLIRYCAGTVLMTNPGKAAAHLLKSPGVVETCGAM